jgi:hypothetical protein
MIQDPLLKCPNLRAARRRQTVVALAIVEDNVEDVRFVIDPSIFRRRLGERYAASAEMLDQTVLIGERRSVNDGISPNTVR